MRCLLIDKIISCEKGKKITGIKNVTMSEDFLQDHFPGFPVMPGVLIIEALAQAACILAILSSDESVRSKVTYFASID
ncbi:MAG: 3-hydroxyacyl-ACP dehydratase FabZ family protein, partial [Pseudomonadota bacterium]